MQHIVYLLLISFGALFILGIFHFTIYLQQKDKAFRNYAFYLLLMSVFNVVRLFDERLAFFYSLPLYTVETWDPVLSNLAFLMYVNFLGVILNITKADNLFYRCWRFIQLFIPAFLLLYVILRFAGNPLQIANTVIAAASFSCMGFGIVMGFRLLALRKEKFYQLIIAGTLISVIGVLTGLIINVFVYKSNAAFEGLYFLEISMLVEAVFLSAALGYRLKMAYQEREKFQQSLLVETKRNAELATQTANLLRKELDIKNWQNEVSRDLHDDIGATLSSMHIYGDLAQNIWDTQPGKSREMVGKISEQSKELIQRMGDVVWSLKSSEEEKNSIGLRLRNYSQELLSGRNIITHFKIDEVLAQKIVSPLVRKNILLIAKEAMNNIAKYSGSAEAFISFKQHGDRVQLIIRDNGKGFDRLFDGQGNGLGNMEQRCKQLKGVFSVQSEPGQGVSITCSFPIAIISHLG
jgi:signal transduction histidine kinase